MLVSFEPQLCFDVHCSKDGRCFCGASAIQTYDEGINTGYCVDCTKKRNEFIDKIIGNIELEKKDVDVSIKILEQLRKKVLQERFCYMTDKYFVAHENEPFSLPYENLSFQENFYREKLCLMNDLIFPIFKTYISNNKKQIKIKKIYNYYEKLLEMYDEDDNKLENIMYLQTGVHTLEYILKQNNN